MATTILLICVGIAGIWLIVLSILFWKLSFHYNTLVANTNKKTLQAILEDLFGDIVVAKKDIAFLKEQCATILKEGQFHIQKIGLLRFNPFNDTGGDQSFILALVDGHNTGVVISGLYSRAGTRWYAKRVHLGKGTDHELSDEEKKALQEAQSIKHISA